MKRGGQAHESDLTSPRSWIGRAGMSGHPVPSNIEHLTMRITPDTSGFTSLVAAMF